MSTEHQFGKTLSHYINISRYSLGQLSELSGIPKTTIANWVQERVKKPRTVNDLLKIATALHLNESDTSTLLQAAGYPPLAEIVRDKKLLENTDNLSLPWMNEIKNRQQKAPFQVLPNLPYFVGRHQELQALKAALVEAEVTSPCALQGMSGIGKTALAVQAAYELRPYFPDGVLWANVNTTEPMLILSAFANAYNHDVNHYTDLGSRSQVVRGILARKRVLIILDDVQSGNELEYLLPPTGECAIIITTRNHHLSMIEGSNRFQLKEFSKKSGDSLALFSRIVGSEKVKKEKKIFREIADLLGHLPLAIIIVASRLAYEPGWSVSNFLERLHIQKRRLDELIYDNKNVRLSFNVSYDVLSPEQQKFLSILTVFGGKDFSAEAVATIAQLSHYETHDALRNLHSLSFIQSSYQQRYRLHPLLRSYAQEKLQDSVYAQRMVDYFIEFVEQHKTNIHRINIENDNIEYALKLAYKRHDSDSYCRGVIAYYRFLDAKGSFAFAENYLNKAKQLAAQINDIYSLASCSHFLGQISDKRGDFMQAERHLQEALQLAKQLDSSGAMSGILTNLGILSAKQGNLDGAETYWQLALENANRSDKHENVCAILSNLGSVAMIQGDFAKAKTHFTQGLETAMQWGHIHQTVHLMANLGELVQKQGDDHQAKELSEKALALSEELGHISKVSVILLNLGQITQNLGNFEQAEAYYYRALQLAEDHQLKGTMNSLLASLGDIMRLKKEYKQAKAYLVEGLKQARMVGNEITISTILNKLGQLQLTLKQIDPAHKTFSEALDIAVKAGFQELIATSLYGLARVEFKRGNLYEAQAKGQESLSLLNRMGHRNVTEVSNWLRTINSVSPVYIAL